MTGVQTCALPISHYLEEAQRFCDAIAIIHQGRLVACDDTETLIHRLDRKIVTITLADDIDAVPPELAAFDAELLPMRRLAIQYRPSKTRIGAILAAVDRARLAIVDLSTEESDLEDLFLALTSGDASDG